MSTLWDLLKSAVLGPARVEPAKPKPWTSSLPLVERKEPRPAKAPKGAAPPALADLPAQARYDALVDLMLSTHAVKVRKWRTSMSGVAFTMKRRSDGRVSRYIESPRPKGPMSAAVFLHEIGHHAIGLGIHRPRCLEEFLAWEWSLAAMREHGVQVTEAVEHRVRLSLWYAVDKAVRRGLRELPAELEPYRERPPRRKKRNEPRA